MKRLEKFLISKAPYAVKRDTFEIQIDQIGDRSYAKGTVDAVWFRRRKGVTVACTGYIWGHQSDPIPESLDQFLANWDGRHGGECLGRWDGTNYWGSQNPDVIGEHLALLGLMLVAYPNVPDGYDGWWSARA